MTCATSLPTRKKATCVRSASLPAISISHRSNWAPKRSAPTKSTWLRRKVAVGTRIVAVSALRFLYAVTLRRDWTGPIHSAPKKDHRLPVILSPREVPQLLQAAPSFTHHVVFSTMHRTGMRVSEAEHLRAANIDSQRMMIRIELSKGHKGREVQLWSCCAAIGGECGLGSGCSRVDSSQSTSPSSPLRRTSPNPPGIYRFRFPEWMFCFTADSTCRQSRGLIGR